MGKKLVRLTESDLHRIVKESVQRILSESGEYLEKELGLPQGGGPFALGRKASILARRQGRFKQADNLRQLADERFEKEFGFNDKDGNQFYLNGIGVPELNGDMLPTSDSKEKRGEFDRNVNALKSYPRMKARKGVETYDKIRDAF